MGGGSSYVTLAGQLTSWRRDDEEWIGMVLHGASTKTARGCLVRV